MTERIKIKNLGPIQDLEVEIRPLTLLVGRQASGKSLVAQVIFFFRAIHSLLMRYYTPELKTETGWQERLIKKILDDLRGTPFGYFAEGTAYLQYFSGKTRWSVHVYRSNRTVRLNKEFKDFLTEHVASLEDRKASELHEWQWFFHNLFIPTERSVFTRLAGKAPTVLYAEFQPMLLRLFAEYLDAAKEIYSKLYEKLGRKELARIFGEDWLGSRNFILEQQIRAIQGKAYIPKHGPKLWKWMVHSEKDEKRIVPIEAASSGQMEAWPFFVVAATMGSILKRMSVYFEEPETHLHPSAQVEVMRTIAYLVGRGQNFFLTTHSPYLLQIVNNMLERFSVQSRESARQSGIALDPEMVAAYRIQGQAYNVLDREGTNLVDADELERVADELGGEFQSLLDEADG